MQAKELNDLLQGLLRHPVDGVVVRRWSGGRLVAQRLGPEETVDLGTLFDVVALVPIEPLFLLKQRSAGQ